LQAAECRDRASLVANVESMAGDARETHDRQQPPPDEAALTARLRRLGDRLSHIRSDAASEQSQAPRPRADPTAMARGFRLSTELVAGVLVGAAIGWALDRWLGISPWGMIVFLLLGFAAGVLNVMRSAGVVPTKTLEPPDSKE
jgi:ATP synthase protein I